MDTFVYFSHHSSCLDGSPLLPSLQRTNVFAIYTNNNAYLFQATNRADMVDWISKIDQFYPVNNLVAQED